MSRWLCLALLFSWNAFAELPPGVYTVLDRYGIPASPDESSATVQKYAAYLQQTKKGGTLHIHVLDPIDVIHPETFVKGKQSQVAPFYSPYVFETLMMDD